MVGTGGKLAIVAAVVGAGAIAGILLIPRAQQNQPTGINLQYTGGVARVLAVRALLASGGTVPFDGALTASNGANLTGQTLTVTVDGAFYETVTTGANGAFSGGFTYTGATGAHTLEAIFAGGTVAGTYYEPSYGTTTFTVTGTPTYTVTFTESGLPSGTEWYVNVAGTVYSSAAASISFTSANGTFNYSVLNVPGYTPSPTSGTLTVDGANVTVPVSFATGTQGFIMEVDASEGPLTVTQNEPAPWSLIGGTDNGAFTVYFGAATQTGTFGAGLSATGQYTFPTAGTISVYAVDHTTGDTSNTVTVTVLPASTTAPVITVNGSAGPLSVPSNVPQQLVVSGGTPGAYCSVVSGGTSEFGGYFDSTGTFTPAAVEFAQGTYSLVATDESSGLSSAPFSLTVVLPTAPTLALAPGPAWDPAAGIGFLPTSGGTFTTTGADGEDPDGTSVDLYVGEGITLPEGADPATTPGMSLVGTATLSGGAFAFSVTLPAYSATIPPNAGPGYTTINGDEFVLVAKTSAGTLSNTVYVVVEASSAGAVQVNVTVFQPYSSDGTYNGTFTLDENNIAPGTPFVAYVNGQTCSPAADSPAWVVPSTGSGTFTFLTPAGIVLNPSGNSFYVVAAGVQSNTVTVYEQAYVTMGTSPAFLPNAGGLVTVTGTAPGFPNGTAAVVTVETLDYKNGVSYRLPNGQPATTTQTLPSVTIIGGTFTFTYNAPAVPSNQSPPNYVTYGAFLLFTAKATAPSGQLVGGTVSINQGII